MLLQNYYNNLKLAIMLMIFLFNNKVFQNLSVPVADNAFLAKKVCEKHKKVRM